MDKDTAIKFMEALAHAETPMGKLDTALSGLDKTEKVFYKNKLGEIFKIHFEIMMSIINQFPELDPDNQGKKMYANFKSKYK